MYEDLNKVERYVVTVEIEAFAASEEQAKSRVQYYMDKLKLTGITVVRAKPIE